VGGSPGGRREACEDAGRITLTWENILEEYGDGALAMEDKWGYDVAVGWSQTVAVGDCIHGETPGHSAPIRLLHDMSFGEVPQSL
jgi:hypothetical protein